LESALVLERATASVPVSAAWAPGLALVPVPVLALVLGSVSARAKDSVKESEWGPVAELRRQADAQSGSRRRS